MNNTIKNVFNKMGIIPKEIINTSKDKVFDVYLTIEQILKAKSFIDFVPQEYQRKYIAKFNKDFLDGIAITLFSRNLNFDITQMHLRIFPDGKQKVLYSGEKRNFYAEILDGLQRLFTIVDYFLNSGYKLPKIETYDTDGAEIDLTDMTLPEVETTYPNFYKSFYKERLLSFKTYVGITSEEATTLFKDILNFNNEMSPQMLRNATTSEVATTIRLSVRLMESKKTIKSTTTPNGTTVEPFNVFDYTLDKTKKVDSKYVDFDNEKLDQEEVVACCAALYTKNAGIENKAIDKIYTDDKNKMSLPWWPSFTKVFKLVGEIIKSQTNIKEFWSKKMFIRFFNFVNTAQKNGYKINTYTKCVNAFYKAVKKLSELTPQEKQDGHKNNAFERAGNNKAKAFIFLYQYKLWQYFLSSNIEDWGMVSIDKKRTFTKKEILDAKVRQDFKCPCCGYDIGIDDTIEGGHIIAHWSGGRTNSDNLVVLHKNCNSKDHMKETEEDK